jgi:hypothetical protein
MLPFHNDCNKFNSKILLPITTGFLLVFLFSVPSPHSALAQTYGEGVYGGSGNNSIYGGGGGENQADDRDSGNDEDENDTNCDDTRPGENPPHITKAILDKVAKTIALTFTSGAGPREGFEIRYTTNPEDFSKVDHYDVDHERNSYDHTIQISNTPVDHYIKVRAVNGCAEGPYSKTQTVKFDGDTTIGTTTYTYERTSMPTEPDGRMGGTPELSGSGGVIDDSISDSIPGLGDEKESENPAGQSFIWNLLENSFALGIVGAMLFFTIGFILIRKFTK